MTGCLPVIATSPCGYFLDFGTVRGGGGGGGWGWGGEGWGEGLKLLHAAQ